MNFYERVYTLVTRVPKGRVATYGQIATLLGSPRSARAVGYALRALCEGSLVPWWRIVNRNGELSIQNMEHPADEQAQLLKAESISVSKHAGRFIVELERYRWINTSVDFFL